jgi:hypothetical protein
MSPRSWARAAVVAALGLAACAHQDDVTYLGPPRPSRGPNCDLQVFLSTVPSYPVAEIGSTRARCSDFSGGRAGCMGLIKKQACEAGADTVFGFSETVDNFERTYMSATLGVRVAGAPAVSAPPPGPAWPPMAGAPAPRVPPPGPAWPPMAIDDGSCTPICSPGFACAAGQCVPQCNPACLPGETCTRKRICEPSGGGAVAAPAPSPAANAAPAAPAAAATRPAPAGEAPRYAPAWPPSAESKPPPAATKPPPAATKPPPAGSKPPNPGPGFPPRSSTVE